MNATLKRFIQERNSIKSIFRGAKNSRVSIRETKCSCRILTLKFHEEIFTKVTSPLGSRAAMRVGSSPFRRTKKKDTLKACLSFWVSRTVGPLHPSIFQCSAEMNSVCAKIFAGGENAYTAHLRRRPESRLGGIYCNRFKTENIDFNLPFQNERHLLKADVFRFGFRRLKGGPALGDQNAWVGETAPSPRFLIRKIFILSLRNAEIVLF